MQNEPLQIEIGRWYRTRSGEIVGPIMPNTAHASRADEWPFQATHADVEITFRRNGQYVADEAGQSHSDLIEPVPAPDSVPTVAPRVGGRYRDRTGRLWGPMSIDRNFGAWPVYSGSVHWSADGKACASFNERDLVCEMPAGALRGNDPDPTEPELAAPQPGPYSLSHATLTIGDREYRVNSLQVHSDPAPPEPPRGPLPRRSFRFE